MASKNKDELAKAIDSILIVSPVKSVDEADRVRRETAKKLAEEIDAYVQFQIGSRLAQILTSISAQGADGASIPVTPGPTFKSLTRTS